MTDTVIHTLVVYDPSLPPDDRVSIAKVQLRPASSIPNDDTWEVDEMYNALLAAFYDITENARVIAAVEGDHVVYCCVDI